VISIDHFDGMGWAAMPPQMGSGAQTSPKLTLLGKSRRSIVTAMEESFSRGMSSVSLAFKRCLCDRVSARF
jgi:hypothetical protein